SLPAPRPARPSHVAAGTARSPATTAAADARSPTVRRSLVQIREAVADPVDRKQIARSRGIRLQLVPDVLDVRVDRALVRFECHAVHGIEELRPREDPTRFARHRGYELELRRRQLDDAVADRRAHPWHIEREISDTNDLGVGPATLGPAKHCAHAGHELPRAERLRDVIVRAYLEAHELVGLF